MIRSRVVATDPIVEEAAREQLQAGASATAAALAGYFAAAGAYSGVLLAPATMVVSDPVGNVRCFDGRARQPGLGQTRPRGIKAGESEPEAARAAVPGSLPALLIALGYDPDARLASVLRPGLARARRAGSDARVELFQRLRQVGGGLFSDGAFVRALLRVAGPAQGGVLGPGDFSSAPDADRPPAESPVAEGTLLEPAWASEVEEADEPALGVGAAVGVVDVRGALAGVVYRRLSEGLLVEELEVELPLLARPVRRGVPRVSPGQRLPCPAPIAVLRRPERPPELLLAPAAGRARAATAPLRLSRE